MSKDRVVIFWHRRDLRWDDNTGLYAALEGDLPVVPVFIFDKNILDDLEDRDDARVTFIHRTLTSMHDRLAEHKAGIHCFHATPEEAWKEILSIYDVGAVYTNRDYEPYARERDSGIEKMLEAQNIPFNTYKDHVIKEPEEILKDNGEPYVVFTPYSRKWKEHLAEKDLESVASALYFNNFHTVRHAIPSLSSMGFTESDLPFPDDDVTDKILRNYGEKRDFPAENGTSRLGIHLRFGTVSIRKIAQRAKETSEVFLNELIWREFYQMILWHFPRVVNENFHKKYDAIQWRNNPDDFERWCTGTTGYPIVDAGMRELNTTGYMHNRVRMIVASFLTKHLLIDWRWGEAYFARKLLDYELASNNGGWQWAAGTGTDAQPYFRIFNPYTQTEKFDKQERYIQHWIPELETDNYPDPIIDHKQARERALDVYKEAVG